MKRTTLALLMASIIAPVALSAENNLLFSYASTKGLIQPLNLTEAFNEKEALKLESGSFTFRAMSGSAIGAFLGASAPSSNTKYLSFYSLNKDNQTTFGIEIRNESNLISNDLLKTSIATPFSDYHTVTYTFDKPRDEINIYVDGVKKQTHKGSKFFSDIPDLSTVFLGKVARLSYNPMQFSGDIFYADASPEVLSEAEIAEKHQAISALHTYSLSKRSELGAEHSEVNPLFVARQFGARNYRIPSLLTTKNSVVIAAIDKRNQHSADWGNIDTVIRRSFDGGKTWQEDQVIMDLASQKYGDKNAAFLIDPLMVQDKQTGRIFMLVDMFPEAQGFFGIKNSRAEGSGYKFIDGKSYRLLTDNEDNQYTVRENGLVYDEQNKLTEYRVVVEGSQSLSFKDLGDLYKGEERLGNIFLYSQEKDNDSAPLKAELTSYLWLTHSDDDGATWSSPVDITPQVKADWMRFLGTGPGTGIQLKNGNLILPVYYTNSHDKQSSAVIISKDGGKTWTRSESPNDRRLYSQGGSRYLNRDNYQLTESQIIELDNGDLKLFSRNLTGKVNISTSKDGGYTWQKEIEQDGILLDPYSQLSVIKYSKKINGKEIVIFANPHSSSRSRVNGKVWLGEVQEDGSIDWKYNTTITTGSYAYNSLTELPNGDIGLLYEESAESINYVSFNLQDLLWHDNYIHRDSRNTPVNISLNSPLAETYYKIGDGEMVKVGEGINLAHLVVQEGTATLNQTANEKGEKQAYETVSVMPEGKLRLNSPDQLNVSHLYLQGGTLDLNGQTLTVDDNVEVTGLRDKVVYGNLVNEKSDTAAHLNYTLSGEQAWVGKLGDSAGKIDFHYMPSHTESKFTLHGDSILNVLDVKNGSIIYAQDTQHKIETLNLAPNTLFALGSNTTATLNQADLSAGSAILANTQAGDSSLLNVNTTGQGSLVKVGEGHLTLQGDLAHQGTTHLSAGQTEFNGSQLDGTLVLAPYAVLGGRANIFGNAILQKESLVSPSLGADFVGNTMRFNNIINEGTQFLLKVNNQDEKMANWAYDQVIVQGDVSSKTSIPVNLQFLAQAQADSDSNKNGQYDADEGLSLIQVYGKADPKQFVLGRTLNAEAKVSDLFKYALVAVDKGVAKTDASSRSSEDNAYFDYRLQTLLVNDKGENPEPVVRAAKAVEVPSSENNSEPNRDERAYRAAVDSSVPSYLVAQPAMFHQGEYVYRQFTQGLSTFANQSIYLSQQNSQGRYHSDLSFAQYGYDYKTKQSSSLLGGNWALSDSLSLHSAVGFSQQTVKPQAVDGWSQSRYKTFSFLAGLSKRWDSGLILQTTAGYHQHSGKLSSEANQIAKIRGKQWQLGAELGYQLAMGDVSLTPFVGLGYHHLTLSSDNTQWNISFEPFHALSQTAGSRLKWQQAWGSLEANVAYEHFQQAHKTVNVMANQQANFSVGQVSDALRIGLAGKFKLGQALSLGLNITERQSLSKAKLRQTEFGANLEYKF